MSEFTRRQALAATGVAVTGVIAGCSNSSAQEPEEDPEPSGTILGEVTVENLHDEPHTVDVLVEFDGEIDHWSTHRLEAGEGGAELERGWPTDPGEFRVTVRLDEDRLMQVTPSDWNDLACLDLTIMVRRNGELRVLSGAGNGACGESSENGTPADASGDDGSGDD